MDQCSESASAHEIKKVDTIAVFKLRSGIVFLLNELLVDLYCYHLRLKHLVQFYKALLR